MTCPAARHGTLSAHGCTCPETRRLRARYRQRWLLLRRRGVHLMPSSVGTVRRIQALMAAGWRSRDIADAAGWRTAEAVTNLLARRYVQLATARRIAVVYDWLSLTVGPSRATRGRAARNGYAPPEAWTADTIDDPAATPWSWDRQHDTRDLDELALERAMAGEPVRLTRDERVEAVLRLTARGLTHSHIADRLHMSGTRVRQILDQHTQGAA